MPGKGGRGSKEKGERGESGGITTRWGQVSNDGGRVVIIVVIMRHVDMRLAQERVECQQARERVRERGRERVRARVECQLHECLRHDEMM